METNYATRLLLFLGANIKAFSLLLLLDFLNTFFSLLYMYESYYIFVTA